MKKYWALVISLVIVIVVLFSTLIIIQNSQSHEFVPEWESKTNDYVYAFSKIGVIEEKVICDGLAKLDSKRSKEYVINDVGIDDILVCEGEVVQEEDLLSLNSEIRTNSKCLINSIIIDKNNIIIQVMEFKYLYSLLKIQQKHIDDIRIGQNVEIQYNDKTFHGLVRQIADFIDDDGCLEVEVEIDSNDIIFPNSKITASIITYTKPNVLVIPREALISDELNYFVDILDGDNVIRRKIEIGIVGLEYVEVKDGLYVDEKVILNMYE